MDQIDLLCVVEDTVYFYDAETQLKFNPLKLAYQRASMRYYYNYLKEELGDTHDIKYFNFQHEQLFWFHALDKNLKNQVVYHIIDPVDRLVESRIEDFRNEYDLFIEWYHNPNFLCEYDKLAEYAQKSKGKKQIFYNFYTWFRRTHCILMNGTKPVGGKYSYDAENRASIPGGSFDEFIEENDIEIQPVFDIEDETKRYYLSAITYVKNNFPSLCRKYKKNLDFTQLFNYPITHEDNKNLLTYFIKSKLEYFGEYEDAIDKNNNYMFHSVLSPGLNIGLINPRVILQTVLKAHQRKKNLGLNNIEGFIRQLFWREYTRYIYLYYYAECKANYLNNQIHLNSSWYNGTTGVEPVDLTIKSAFKYGYLHHINRLMIMCNFMNLMQIHPDDVYRWFMEFSLDSYDWVMIFNVYAMGLYASSEQFVSKPYISSSVYVLKMSNYQVPKGETSNENTTWTHIWNILYYYFIYRNQKKIKGRGAIYLSQWARLAKTEQAKIIKEAKAIIKRNSLKV
jgi:deoxyribodipyrimidine photolyase-related protein